MKGLELIRKLCGELSEAISEMDDEEENMDEADDGEEEDNEGSKDNKVSLAIGFLNKKKK